MPHRLPPDRPLALLAERDPSVRELQAHFLDAAGFAVAFADDGLAARESARSLLPAVVVTEILIPKLDGLALCRALRADPATQDIPVIVFSILAAAPRAAEAGAHAFLRKPIVESTFLAAIRNAVATRSPGRQEQQWAAQ